ncbi:MFS transporter [Myroides sp. WP-1]|uniref:MFS transporter n=1 Tax=Myroides sp. WP-1 TaxID=2759944 RepID=UPI0015FDBFC2|nr:MFS transporter [Myroides sp. WP-1]MBB1138195.1 MFS transporter [Myroides sp. WP-1]
MILKDKWVILFILLLATILSPLDFYIVNLALPSMQQSLKTTNSELQMIVSFYTCAYAVFQISGGRLGDIYGRRKIFLLGLLGFISFSVLCGVAQSAMLLIIGRIGQGVSGAIMIPQVLAIVHGLFNDKEKRWVMALYSFTFGIAAALGQFLGALLIEWNLFDLGWRIIFLVNVPVGLLAFGLGFVALPKQEVNQVASIDYQGTLLLSLGLMSFIYPLTTLIERGFTLETGGYLLSACLLIYLFVRLEQKRKQQAKSVLIDFDIFQFSKLKIGVIISFLYYASGVFYLVFGIFLQQEWHWTRMEAGQAIIPFGVGFIVMSLCSSILSNYIREAILSVGLWVYVAGFILLWATLYHYHPLLFAFDLFVIGCGMGLTLSSVVRLSLSQIPIQFAGLASGIVNCGLQIGSAFGVAALGSVFFALVKIQSYTFAFGIVLGLICFFLLLAIYLAQKMK